MGGAQLQGRVQFALLYIDGDEWGDIQLFGRHDGT